jgi:hypothetical protein
MIMLRWPLAVLRILIIPILVPMTSIICMSSVMPIAIVVVVVVIIAVAISVMAVTIIVVHLL